VMRSPLRLKLLLLPRQRLRLSRLGRTSRF
jgi:hypothetical protein